MLFVTVQLFFKKYIIQYDQVQNMVLSLFLKMGFPANIFLYIF